MQRIRGPAVYAAWLVSLVLLSACAAHPPAAAVARPESGNELAVPPRVPIANPQDELPVPIAGTGQAAMADLLDRILSGGSFASAACLPLVYRGIDADEYSVSELGVRFAEELAEALRERMNSSGVLGPAELEVRLRQVNIGKQALFEQEDIAEHADRLGVDLVLYGKIKRRRDRRRPMGESLEVDVRALNLRYDSAASKKIELPSWEDSNQTAWRLCDEQSLWEPTRSYDSPEHDRSFEDEIQAVVGILCQRILSVDKLQQLDRTKEDGSIYIPPADSAILVKEIYKVREAQIKLGESYRKRLDAELVPGEEDSGPRPGDRFVWGGQEYKDIRHAIDEVNAAADALRSGSAAMFGETISSMFIEELRPHLHPRRPIMDVGFTGQNALLVDAALASGTLANRELATSGSVHFGRARELLQEKKVEIVVAPKIEQVGRHFSLRVEIYDLNPKKPSVRSSQSQRIDSRFTPQLAKELGVETLEAQPPLDTGWRREGR